MGVEWRIYYTDGTTFDAGAGGPEMAPPLGISCIVQRRVEDGLRFVLHSFDWYYWHAPTRQWWGSDLPGVLDQFCHFPLDVTALKMGRNLPDERFKAILLTATNDPDFLGE